MTTMAATLKRPLRPHERITTTVYGAPGALPTPFTIIIDTREQRAFSFEGLTSDADRSKRTKRPLAVRTTRGTLPSGDYSLLGWETSIAIERKSASDLFSTLGWGRARFMRELERLNDGSYDLAEVIVEADWYEIVNHPPRHTKLSPKTVFRSVLAWKQRYRRVHWSFCPGRRFAEVLTFRTLERYWKDRSGHTRQGPRTAKG